MSSQKGSKGRKIENETVPSYKTAGFKRSLAPPYIEALSAALVLMLLADGGDLSLSAAYHIGRCSDLLRLAKTDRPDKPPRAPSNKNQFWPQWQILRDGETEFGSLIDIGGGRLRSPLKAAPGRPSTSNRSCWEAAYTTMSSWLCHISRDRMRPRGDVPTTHFLVDSPQHPESGLGERRMAVGRRQWRKESWAYGATEAGRQPEWKQMLRVDSVSQSL